MEKEGGKRRNLPDIRRVDDGWRKWIGRCGHGVAGGVGATGLVEKYRTAGGGIAGVSADRRQDKSRRAAASDAGKQAMLQAEQERNRREREWKRWCRWCRCEVCDDAASESDLALAGGA